MGAQERTLPLSFRATELLRGMLLGLVVKRRGDCWEVEESGYGGKRYVPLLPDVLPHLVYAGYLAEVDGTLTVTASGHDYLRRLSLRAAQDVSACLAAVNFHRD